MTKQVGLLDLHQTKLAKQYFNGSLRDALAFLKSGQENLSSIKSALVKREGDVANGQLSDRESDQGAVDPRGQADSAGAEAGVVAQPGRERATENGELGTGQQGWNTKYGGLSDRRLGRDGVREKPGAGTEGTGSNASSLTGQRYTGGERGAEGQTIPKQTTQGHDTAS